jgi:hypothetical protein
MLEWGLEIPIKYIIDGIELKKPWETFPWLIPSSDNIFQLLKFIGLGSNFS